MPYEWIDPANDAAPAQPPEAVLHLWPYRSLPKQGFVWFVSITAALFILPLLGVFGTPVLWGLLPFFILAIAATWFAIQKSYRDGMVLEELQLWPERVRLMRHNPGGPAQSWEANPHWVQVQMHRNRGPVENYVTLRGAGREVEIGAFLSIEERCALYDDLTRRLGAA